MSDTRYLGCPTDGCHGAELRYCEQCSDWVGTCACGSTGEECGHEEEGEAS